jgi:hypothetical protein
MKRLSDRSLARSRWSQLPHQQGGQEDQHCCGGRAHDHHPAAGQGCGRPSGRARAALTLALVLRFPRLAGRPPEPGKSIRRHGGPARPGKLRGPVRPGAITHRAPRRLQPSNADDLTRYGRPPASERLCQCRDAQPGRFSPYKDCTPSPGPSPSRPASHAASPDGDILRVSGALPGPVQRQEGRADPGRAGRTGGRGAHHPRGH